MKKVDLEILISTMNRTDLAFLTPMFPDRKLSEFNILIVNQTEPDKILDSDTDNIRVINSFERGLSKSRNLAFKNSIGEVALIADDDIIYFPGFDKIIVGAFDKYPNATLITFQMSAPNNKRQKKYINTERQITTLLGQPKPTSFEMAVRPRLLVENNLYMNEFFGLGAEFPAREETLFMVEILKKNGVVHHIPKLIVEHLDESTGAKQGNKKFIRALSGMKYLEYGEWSRLWLLKFVFFLVRNKFIPISRTVWAYRIGIKAIKRSKEIFKTNNPLQ